MPEEPKPTYISKSKPYCVYTHSYHGEIFYVGKGVSVRPFQKEGRNKKWNSFVDKVGRYQVDIVFWTASDEEAFKKEKELIMKYKPSCNRYMRNGNISAGNMKRRITKRKKELFPISCQLSQGLIDIVVYLAKSKGVAVNTMVTELIEEALQVRGMTIPRDTQETV